MKLFQSLSIAAVILAAVTSVAAQPVFTVPKAYPLPQASVTIGWDANPPGQNVTSYNLYWGDKTRAYTNVANTTTTAYTLPVVRGSTNYIAVTAMVNTIESLFSTELIYIAPAVPSSPTNVVKVSVVVEGSTNMLKWIKLATVPDIITLTNPQDPITTFRSYLSIVNSQP